MPSWVRVSMPGVGKWTQSATAPVPEGAKVLDEPATDGSGTPLTDESDPPTVRAEIVTGAAWPQPKPAKSASKTKEA